MNMYRITNRITKESYTTDANSAQGACESLGWMIGNCHVIMLHEIVNTMPAYTPLVEPQDDDEENTA